MPPKEQLQIFVINGLPGSGNLTEFGIEGMGFILRHIVEQRERLSGLEILSSSS
ncbi:hypothetical protein M0R04_02970 [Candidatus Dojkabacteria bacterium]|nr:hypothetical protein [Candidatus Dojkabacteria bacterium]